MSVIDDLVAQIQDNTLKDRITNEVAKLESRKKYGLVFEEHIPECTPLYGFPIRKGASVAVKKGYIQDLYTVTDIQGDLISCVQRETLEQREFNRKEIVAVAEFGEPIYPYLKPVNMVSNAPDSSLWHILIEAENYHALQLLEYLYSGKVDCIYIDPPYNTGSRDWKYNNDYVDGNDMYRHSKWLSMMSKRLKIAKRLLKSDGVMIVAIDDNELNTLGMLLQDLFSEYDIFCVTIVHNPNGNQGQNFGRTNEYAYFITPHGRQVLSLEDRTDNPDIRPLRDVSGNSNMRTDANNCFYPIYIKDNKIIGFGDVCDDSYHPGAANILRNDGTIEVYPIDAKDNERKWVFARQTVESIKDELYVEWNKSRSIYDIIRCKNNFTYKTVWDKKSLNANSYGSKLINSIFGDKRFEYPKSVYAVYECIKAVCKDRKNALVLDFFAGSGTTLQSVNLLNAEDGGSRQCIMVTNNEVSEKEAKTLTAQGFKPGDEQWEKYGIARYVAWPRTVCSILGCDIYGKPLDGDYGVDVDAYEVDYSAIVVSPTTGKPVKRKSYKKTSHQLYPALAGMKKSDGFKTNAIFFKLGFLDKITVALGRQFRELLPVIWMKAGAVGQCPVLQAGKLPHMLIYPENHFAVLLDEAGFADFAAELRARNDIDVVFIVTDSEQAYRSMISGLCNVETYQLYRDYLDNFRINIRG